MKISRRDFVTYSSGLFSSLIPFVDLKSVINPRAPLADNRKILVLIHLAGGNDWFNTVIPYQAASYYRERPSISIAPDKVLRLDEQYALHPNLTAIKKLYEQNKVAILLNVGSSQPTLSHAKAVKYRQYIGTDRTWQESYAEHIRKNKNVDLVFPCINVQPYLFESNSISQQEKIADQVIVSSLNNSNNFEFDLDIHYKLTSDNNGYSSRSSSISKLVQVGFNDINRGRLFPLPAKANGFVEGMKLIANSIQQKINASVYNISLGGFDTHANQLDRHAQLLQSLSEGIVALQSRLEKAGIADRIITLIQSEFGRSLRENDNSGTDHGHTNHVLAIGNAIEGGIYGNQDMVRSISRDRNSEQYDFDYRNVLGTVMDTWLGCPILGQKPNKFVFI